MVMFSARKCVGIDTGYTSSSRAVSRYSVCLGPGTLEMTRLNTGCLRALPVTMAGPSGAAVVMPCAIFCRRGIFDSRAFASVVLCTMACSRASGSPTCVARLASSRVTWLPPASVSPCSDTGTIAIRGFLGSLLCASRYLRSAPEQIASVTSLTVAPVASPMRLSRASEYDCAAKRREPEISTLNGVGGAWNGRAAVALVLSLRSMSHRPLPMPGRISRPARAASASWASSPGAARGPREAGSAASDCAHSGGLCSFAEPDRPSAIIFAPVTPSTSAWWILM